MRLIGQIIGFVAIGESILVFLSLKRDRILIYKVISDILWALNMLFMGLGTGAIVNTVNVAREFVFYNKAKRKWAKSVLWFWFFAAASLVSPIITWAGFKSLLPAIGSFLSVVGLYSNNAKAVKLVSIPSQGFWLTYSIITQNYASTVCNVFLITSAVIGLVREFRAERKNKNISKVA